MKSLFLAVETLETVSDIHILGKNMEVKIMSIRSASSNMNKEFWFFKIKLLQKEVKTFELVGMMCTNILKNSFNGLFVT